MTNEFWFDDDAAARPVRFFRKVLRHTKGEWAGKPFVLAPWQEERIIRPLFGERRRSDDMRRYRRAYIEIPRKNGKSSLSAGIALYLLVADGEPGAEVYSAAADRDQAAIVFEQAKSMVERSPELSKLCKVYKRAIVVPSTESVYRVLSADAYTKHGLNAHGIIFDELHAQRSRDLYDVLNTSTGARRQPLMLMITTAGDDTESICYEQHEYARQVLEGTIEDDSFFAFIAAADREDDWTSPAVWAKANPGLGVSIKLDYLQEECRRALTSVNYQNTFRRLHLNQWTQQADRWIPMHEWNECAAPLPDLSGRPCFAGLDLSSTTDLSALVLAFPAQGDKPLYLLPFFWMPEENLTERERRDRAPYFAWVQEGLIELTPGNVIDYDYIFSRVVSLGEKYKIQMIGYDPWNATQTAIKLEGAGFQMVQMRQGYQTLNEPSKEFERLVLAHGLAHGGHKVLRWMADNVAVKRDPAGNIKPDKSRKNARIDGIVASIMAIGLVMRNKPAQSVYESRGVREL